MLRVVQQAEAWEKRTAGLPIPAGEDAELASVSYALGYGDLSWEFQVSGPSLPNAPSPPLSPQPSTPLSAAALLSCMVHLCLSRSASCPHAMQ